MPPCSNLRSSLRVSKFPSSLVRRRPGFPTLWLVQFGTSFVAGHHDIRFLTKPTGNFTARRFDRRLRRVRLRIGQSTGGTQSSCRSGVGGGRRSQTQTGVGGASRREPANPGGGRRRPRQRPLMTSGGKAVPGRIVGGSSASASPSAPAPPVAVPARASGENVRAPDLCRRSAGPGRADARRQDRLPRRETRVPGEPGH